MRRKIIGFRLRSNFNLCIFFSPICPIFIYGIYFMSSIFYLCPIFYLCSYISSMSYALSMVYASKNYLIDFGKSSYCLKSAYNLSINKKL